MIVSIKLATGDKPMHVSAKRYSSGRRTARQQNTNNELAKHSEDKKKKKKNWTNNRIITILQTFATTYDRSHKFTTYLLVSSKGCLFHNALAIFFVSHFRSSLVRLPCENFYCTHHDSISFFWREGMTILFNETIRQISIRSSSRSLCSTETEYNNVNKDIMVLISLWLVV